MGVLKVLDLFSGIGGFSLGLEKTGGFETTAFCEVEKYPRSVLAKHWPDVPIYNDVRELTGERLRADGIDVDVICGGFPCQDISTAGKGAGLRGERSGLWFEYARIIEEVGPSWVIIENVSALRGRGLSTVLQNLSEIGYDAEWHCITAAYVGAPHRRDRIWILGYPQSKRCGKEGKPSPRQSVWASSAGATPGDVADSNKRLQTGDDTEAITLSPNADSNGSHSQRLNIEGETKLRYKQDCDPKPLCKDVADANVKRGNGCPKEHRTHRGPLASGDGSDECPGSRYRPEDHWRFEPNVGRVAHGVPRRVDRLKCLGNSVVPQIPEMIGHHILECGINDDPK